MLKAWMEIAIRRDITAGIQQMMMARQPPPSVFDSPSIQSLCRTDLHYQQAPPPEECCMIQHTHSHDVQDEEEQEDQMEQIEERSIHDSDQVLSEVDALERGMSHDEGIKPDQPVFTGLFRPQLFKSLLFKAKTTARLDIPSPLVQQSVVQGE
uniref:Uncharacterized protein n=1 Tax=Micrurus spixii TaxID=129469 RepID=A0A2D4MYP9_9SAUR